ncbi:testicular acid phosphatase homolog [Ixodes scapularis]|uniref:testicular acid phosphatase homolog n=1 Tax=Ixodes scapularis TaxID=6945 RepID=UPI001A9F7094|nr:testicular acid phosphatase homolog [Ixodes scapularis]
MVHSLLQVICLLLVSPPSFCTQAQQNASVPQGLDLVVGLFRHGDRAPLTTFPTDLNRNSTLWIDGLGNLTARGKQTMRKVGEYLRERYLGFSMCDPNETIVRSSPKYRCFKSAALVLDGLYPDKKQSLFHLTRMPEHHDKYTLICKPQIKKILWKLFNPFSGLLKLAWFVVRAAWELQISLFKNNKIIPDALDALLVQKEYGLKIPHWFEERYGELSDASRRLYLLIAEGLIRHMGGELLRDIATLLEERYQPARNETKNATVISGFENATSETKFLFFSYHDLNIMATLMVLNETFSQKPFYGSIVLFEVTRQNQSEHEIRVLYRNGTADPVVFPINGCGSPCTVTEFIKLVRKKFPTPFTAEDCGLPKNYTIL